LRFVTSVPKVQSLGDWLLVTSQLSIADVIGYTGNAVLNNCPPHPFHSNCARGANVMSEYLLKPEPLPAKLTITNTGEEIVCMTYDMTENMQFAPGETFEFNLDLVGGQEYMGSGSLRDSPRVIQVWSNRVKGANALPAKLTITNTGEEIVCMTYDIKENMQFAPGETFEFNLDLVGGREYMGSDIFRDSPRDIRAWAGPRAIKEWDTANARRGDRDLRPCQK